MLSINTAGVQDRSEFVSKVYTMLGVSLLFCAGGAYYGLSMPMSLYWPMVIAEFIVLFACMFLHRSYPLNIVLLFLFTTLSGLTLGPVLTLYTHMGMGGIIPEAAATTAVTFGVLSAYVHISKQDFSFLGGFLFMALIGMIVISLLGMFIHLPLNNTLYSGFGVLIFSGYILLDTSNLLRRYNDDQYVAATLGLYLDIINLFLFMLRLLSDRRR
jgi:FtsH-binding integral membrane protein